MKPLALNALLAAIVCIASLAAYDWIIARPYRTVGVVDSVAVFRLEEERLASQMARDMSAEQRDRLASQARAFAREFPRALEQVAIDCGCLVVERSAVIGTPPHMVDLTPELKRRMQL
ncbi:hypothetical protein [Duganella vulcania]|uniref:Type-F conjugative transfer system protein TrbI n=1 Tax=Duganella vulcania TaxID=2692166 RepID=A0A845GRT1_9BURK|nr:hypothetical protein [Duganella vulcania]MYM95918.1 hypothetical protein [Duganella vulcania]